MGGIPRKYMFSRKYKGFCEKCGKKSKEYFSKIDENNVAITFHAQNLCRECYEKENL